MAAVSVVYCHEDNTLVWKQYARSGFAIGESAQGMSGYYRLNRRTDFTFKDLRLWGYALGSDSFVYLRYKSSRRFGMLPGVYTFTTIHYRQNTKAGMNLQYHFNQGFGVFLARYPSGHINCEAGHAFDSSDYLNDTRKTSYLKGGLYWDHNAGLFNTKVEAETFYQISDESEMNLSRTVFEGEITFPFKKGLLIAAGTDQEIYHGTEQTGTQSYYISLGWSGNLNWEL